MKNPLTLTHNELRLLREFVLHHGDGYGVVAGTVVDAMQKPLTYVNHAQAHQLLNLLNLILNVAWIPADEDEDETFAKEIK